MMAKFVLTTTVNKQKHSVTHDNYRKAFSMMEDEFKFVLQSHGFSEEDIDELMYEWAEKGEARYDEYGITEYSAYCTIGMFIYYWTIIQKF